MPSSFKGLDLFGSGPHRFASLREGTLVVTGFALGGSSPGGVALGLVDVEVRVLGRLVAVSEPVLWRLRDAIAAQLAFPPVPGVLVDQFGRRWEGMSLTWFEPAEKTDRGRERSLAYECAFRRLP
jgi:hypothetical protein